MDVVASRKLVAFLAVALWGLGPGSVGSGALAASTTAGDALGAIPAELQLPEELPNSGTVEDLNGAQTGTVSTFGSAVGSARPMDMAVDEWPARLESSGTWFRRGFWYVEQDVVILNRDYGSNLVLAVDASDAKVNFFVSPPRPVFPSKRTLAVDRSKPDAAAAARLTLGRFLFRDSNNRDNMVEFTYLGLGHWGFQRSVESVRPDRLFTPLGAFADAVTFVVETGGYNFANAQHFNLKTKFDSYEWNYQLRYRHRKDQMELGPDGQWTRKMMPSGFHSYLFGLRYLYLQERFGWQSEAVAADLLLPDNSILTRSAATGDMRIHTRNDLIGIQFGADMIRQWPRWSAGIRGKAGPFVNFAQQGTDLTIQDPQFGDADRHVNAHEETFSFLGELRIFAHYHLRPNMTLRAAFEGLWLSSVANAAEQVEFDTASIPVVRAGGSQSYMGASFGFDLYW